MIAESVALGGKPETAQFDADLNRVFVNIENKNEVVEVDLKEHKVLNHWPLGGPTAPSLRKDLDLVQSAAKALGAEVVMVKAPWPTLMKDFLEKCDLAVGGISVTTDRQKTAFFTTAYMVNGKAPITKCDNVAKFQTIADIDKPNVTVIENPGGSNERFARANFKQAKIVIFPDNVTIFDEILKGNADVMISESVETILQHKIRPGLCAVNPDKPLQYGEMAWLLPRGDGAMKEWMDTWLHLAKASGEYDRITGPWLR